jgi:magnesium-transporting ATPase (P-type)
MAAIAAFAPDPGWRQEQKIPFSSERKWSAAKFEGHGWWVAGAPDALDPSFAAKSEGRALLLAGAESVDRSGEFSGLRPVAMAQLSETIKPSARRTIELLAKQGVSVKVISGDDPASVAGIARLVGIPVRGAVHGRDLPASGAELAALLESVSILGRVSPEQKQLVVRALKSSGHTVAMVGDGVNDVLALKEADLGIAMGGGSAAARAVAACVLTDGSFDAMPAILGEGRRVIGNVERLASLFFTKTVYAFLLAVAVGLATVPFPFLPRQLTLVSAFTIGIPSVFLALAPTFEPSRSGFLRRVLRFAVPAGAVAGAATFAAYALALSDPALAIDEERTVATLVIAAIGLWVLARLAQPLTTRRMVLLAGMAAGLTLTLLVPQARELFALDFPRPIVLAAAAGIVAAAILVFELSARVIGFASGRRSA